MEFVEFSRKIKVSARDKVELQRVLPALAYSLMIAYIWLNEFNLIPSQIKTMTVRQLKKHLSLINDLYIVDNKYLFRLYHWKVKFCKIV